MLPPCRVHEKPNCPWRVGVHLPLNDSLHGDPRHAAVVVNKAKAALMQLEVVEEEVMDDDGDHLQGRKLILQFTRADHVTGLLEVDREGRICKAGDTELYQPGGLAVNYADGRRCTNHEPARKSPLYAVCASIRPFPRLGSD
jgi:hypothetical protein